MYFKNEILAKWRAWSRKIGVKLEKKRIIYAIHEYFTNNSAYGYNRLKTGALHVDKICVLRN